MLISSTSIYMSQEKASTAKQATYIHQFGSWLCMWLLSSEIPVIAKLGKRATCTVYTPLNKHTGTLAEQQNYFSLVAIA